MPRNTISPLNVGVILAFTNASHLIFKTLFLAHGVSLMLKCHPSKNRGADDLGLRPKSFRLSFVTKNCDQNHGGNKSDRPK